MVRANSQILSGVLIIWHLVWRRIIRVTRPCVLDRHKRVRVQALQLMALAALKLRRRISPCALALKGGRPGSRPSNYTKATARQRGNPETMNQNSHCTWINKRGLATGRFQVLGGGGSYHWHQVWAIDAGDWSSRYCNCAGLVFSVNGNGLDTSPSGALDAS